MTERPTFCPRCLKMHTGICPDAAFKPTERKPPPELPALLPMKMLTVEEARAQFPTAPKFDKKAYQREYMRERRAKQPKRKAP